LQTVRTSIAWINLDNIYEIRAVPTGCIFDWEAEANFFEDYYGILTIINFEGTVSLIKKLEL